MIQNSTANNLSKAEVQDWVISYLSELLEIEPEEIDPTLPFDRYGLDSTAAAALTSDLEDWLEQEIDPILLYDYPTVEQLAEYLAAR
ncbi:MAG: acyl carrier protein [Cyanobacteria bacterium P01_A01_bin.83]